MDFCVYIVIAVISVWLLCFKRFGSGPRTYSNIGDGEVVYQRKRFKVPVARGVLLKIACRILHSVIGEFFLADLLLRLNNMTIFRTANMPDEPTFVPIVPFVGRCADTKLSPNGDEVQRCMASAGASHAASKLNGIFDYHKAYRDGWITPTEVANNLFSSYVKAKSLKAIVRYDSVRILQMAEESTRRYLEDKPLSPLDGVPILIKDEFPVAGYPYSCGTSFLGEGVETEHCEIVKRLVQLGAMIVGTANMHELGLGTTGSNPNKDFGTPRNPYNTNHYTGGSSSGCASAVASGLCVAAIGTDGGGSIRIPSSYCGIVGVKPTFGRISLAGIRNITFTVGHAGPMCTSVKDATFLYALLAYADPEYQPSLQQPSLKLPDFSDDIKGLKIGIYQDYFEDCDDDMRMVCRNAVDALQKEKGVAVKDIEIPELDETRTAHLIVILAEMTNAIQYEYDHNLESLTWESQLLFRVGRKLSSSDLLQANKQRTRCMNFLKDIFQEVDVIVTPTTGQTAPAIHPGDLSAGSLDSERDMKNMRFVYIGNLAGIPSVSVPVGYSKTGLPVGLQVMAAWWKEDVMLKVAYNIESLLVHHQLPPVYYDILKKS